MLIKTIGCRKGYGKLIHWEYVNSTALFWYLERGIHTIYGQVYFCEQLEFSLEKKLLMLNNIENKKNVVLKN